MPVKFQDLKYSEDYEAYLCPSCGEYDLHQLFIVDASDEVSELDELACDTCEKEYSIGKNGLLI
jgi:hypothetical protein